MTQSTVNTFIEMMYSATNHNEILFDILHATDNWPWFSL